MIALKQDTHVWTIHVCVAAGIIHSFFRAYARRVIAFLKMGVRVMQFLQDSHF